MGQSVEISVANSRIEACLDVMRQEQIFRNSKSYDNYGGLFGACGRTAISGFTPIPGPLFGASRLHTLCRTDAYFVGV